MTMKFIEDNSEVRKKMNEMKDGEVCQMVDTLQYVVKVTHIGQEDIYLILDNDKETNSYGASCDATVRELDKGETVTIEFS